MTLHELPLTGWCDYRLVALSLLMATFASFAALDLAGRTTAALICARFARLGGGAAVN